MVQSVHVYVPVKADLNCLLFFYHNSTTKAKCESRNYLHVSIKMWFKIKFLISDKY